MNKHKLIQSVIGILFAGIALTLLVSNYPTTTVSQSVVTETNNSRILIYGNDTQLLNDYNTYLAEKEIAIEVDQELYKKTEVVDDYVAGFDLELLNNVVESTPEPTVKPTKAPTVSPTKTPKSNRWNITLSKNEIELLARIVKLESGGESSRGEIMVIETIFNRMKHKMYPNSLYDVLSDSGQFTTWRNRNTRKATPTEKEYKNIKKVLNGETNVLSSSYVYFSVGKVNEKGDTPEGNHWFCQY